VPRTLTEVGRVSGRPRLAKPLSDEDIADVAAYYTRIEITARIPDNLR
jgi:cytochrome c553